MNSSINKIKRIIKKEIDEIKIKNNVKEDEPSIKMAKKSLFTARLALLISFAASAITLYMNFLHGK